MKTTEEKIQMCIRYLQGHGYSVIFPVTNGPKKDKRSAHVAALVAQNRETMLRLGGASAATLMSIRDVTAATGISAATISAWVKDGKFPAPIIGGGRGSNLRWRLADVKAFCDGKTA